ncbi:Serpentine Receptor, class E (Epsilon) [Caenorhabditis elegans]|uniref:Serpentine Receptor, class E (Epsilon) n=1 Tax=Caenorhabditis elegans TaxID=6239 RepID=Q5WRM6_CAEEL|nr:Serpentine Receptor, class E (Epsilon) [Caenorhabditis elegans]CAH60791.2 Serpentine Receptor, class E (Epsilon) [Caenorhabditis elegans]|eukprot:NP_001022395.1 Serpentine Receptor, class E (epsilon) [Caenorhabditis elegans]
MIIRYIANSTNYSLYWLPIYFYDEPFNQQVIISIVEIALYILCSQAVNAYVHVTLKIRLFHRNLYILSVPICILWYLLIAGKCIVIGYRLNFLKIDVPIGEHTNIWTEDIAKMLNVSSLKGLELMLLSGFLQWYYMYSFVFMVMAMVAERIIASVLIENYESNTQLLIPVILTVASQSLSIFVSFALLFHKINPCDAQLPWIISCVLTLLACVFVKVLNESFQREIKNPGRKRHFTISQQFQVKENLRALRVGIRLVITVLSCIALYGLGIAALNYEIIPPIYCHFVENLLFLDMIPIALTAIISVSHWRKEFARSYLTFNCLKVKQKILPMENVDCQRKKLDIETDLYFKQLARSWI